MLKKHPSAASLQSSLTTSRPWIKQPHDFHKNKHIRLIQHRYNKSTQCRLKAMKLVHALGLAAAAASSSLHTVSAAGCFDGSSPFHSNDWSYCQEISDTLFMYYTPLDDTIMLGLHATEGVTGWSSLAPAGNGGMKGT